MGCGSPEKTRLPPVPDVIDCMIKNSGERYRATYYNDAWLQPNDIKIEPYCSMLQDFLDSGRFRFDLADVKTARGRTL
jgi:hypothetical protein